MKTVFFNDRERLEFLSSQFPQTVVDLTADSLIATGTIPELGIESIDAHREGTENVAYFKFDDSEIQEKFEHFNKAVEELDNFMGDHFSYFKPPDLKTEKTFKGLYQLYPRQRRGSHEEREFYYGYRSKLTKLTNKFARSYYELLRVGIKNISLTTENVSALENNLPHVSGSNFYIPDNKPISITRNEREILGMLTEQAPNKTPNDFIFPLVSVERLASGRKTSRDALELALGRLRKKSPRGKLFDIVKETKKEKRRRVTGYKLVVRRPQKLMKIDSS